MIASDLATFFANSISGGAITAYDSSGSPVNMQMRWAQTDSALICGADNWNLFYQTDSSAVGAAVAWQNAGIDYTFAANGQMSPAVPIVTLTGVTVDGVSLGNVVLQHGAGGLTQFADAMATCRSIRFSKTAFRPEFCNRCRSTTRAAWSARFRSTAWLA